MVVIFFLLLLLNDLVIREYLILLDGLKYQNKGDFDSALKMFNKSLSVSPYHYETLKNKMYLLIKHYKYDEAYEVLSDIITYYPKLNVDRIKMAKYYIRAKRYDYVNNIILSFNQIQDEKILTEIDKIIKFIR